MKSEFQKLMEKEIRRLEIDIDTLSIGANQTRDFLAEINFHAVLNSLRIRLTTVKAALEAYKKAGAK